MSSSRGLGGAAAAPAGAGVGRPGRAARTGAAGVETRRRVSRGAGERGRRAGAAARRRGRARHRSVRRVSHPGRRARARAGIRRRKTLPCRRRVRPDRALQGRRARRARSSRIPAAIRRRRCWRCCRSRKPACSTRTAASSSTRSPASPAPAARRAIARTSRRTTARSSAYGVFGHRHVAEMEQELGAAVTFVPHLVPLDRGILETIYVKVAPGTTAEQIADAFNAAYARRAVRAADRRRAAGDQARRVDELLRHRLAARRRHRAGW